MGGVKAASKMLGDPKGVETKWWYDGTIFLMLTTWKEQKEVDICRNLGGAKKTKL